MSHLYFVRLITVGLIFIAKLSLAQAEKNDDNIDSSTYLEFTNKAVLVTGANSGIGRRITETLASKGVFVYAGARKNQDIKDLSQIENVMGIRLDVTKEDDINSAVKVIENQGRGLYGVVNNAGVFFHAPLIEVSEKELEFMMNVNVFGPYRISKAFAPLILQSRGRISNISSIAGISAGPLFGPYAMSKFSVEAYSESLFHEMKRFGVEVSVIEPGNFKSDIMKNMRKRRSHSEEGRQPTRFEKEYKALENFTATDRSRHKDPIMVANAVTDALFSKSPKFRYLVAPTQSEANLALRAAVSKVAQLNKGHQFSIERDALISTLDEFSK